MSTGKSAAGHKGKMKNLLPTDPTIALSHFTTAPSRLACFWETSTKAFSALLALASAGSISILKSLRSGLQFDFQRSHTCKSIG
jgi:hypothetical protein